MFIVNWFIFLMVFIGLKSYFFLGVILWWEFMVLVRFDCLMIQELIRNRLIIWFIGVSWYFWFGDCFWFCCLFARFWLLGSDLVGWCRHPGRDCRLVWSWSFLTHNHWIIVVNNFPIISQTTKQLFFYYLSLFWLLISLIFIYFNFLYDLMIDR
jgi:hypothetical protein